ncbi:unnamed protein product [Tuber melanosporum]|uniref:(Perigord truffle) hypothetical protein n=1 Tax=Tuber melanosporum (strain Mel28) TaxID=656061 RepID=D5GKR2_TUBMM|nr:uncharacterized protein GSTUM_00009715001 [Tuber melanosporum]CAZ85105.1 unnamed protein product [Tuber melanosporum]
MAQTLHSSLLSAVFAYLDTQTLFTASLTCKHWRATTFLSRSHSPQLLRPHLSMLRAHFGRETVPHRIPIPTVEKLFTQYVRETAPAWMYSRRTYLLPPSHGAVSVSCDGGNGVEGKMAVVVGRNKVYVYDITESPITQTHTIQISDKVSKLAVKGGYLALSTKRKLHLYALLSNGLSLRLYSVPIPAVEAIALGRAGKAEEPLVAITTKDKTAIIHPSYALWRRRNNFFLQGSGSVAGASTGQSGRWEDCPWILVYRVTGERLSFKSDGRGVLVGNSLLGVWDGEERNLARTWKGFGRRLVLRVEGDGAVCFGSLVGAVNKGTVTVQTGEKIKEVSGGKCYTGCSQGRAAYLAFSRAPGQISVAPIGEGKEQTISLNSTSEILSITGGKERIVVAMGDRIVTLNLWNPSPDSQLKIEKDGSVPSSQPGTNTKYDACVIQ